MELRHLRYFVAVAESLHFGQAAAKLRIAQPSLSHQIRQLEDEVQTSLLRRTNRRVELTDAGRLRVGIGYCTDQTDIAALLGAFHDQHPDIHLETKTLSVPLQLAALLDGQLDVGFVRPPVSDSALNSEVVISEPLVVALPPKHRLASRRRFQLSALANEPFILPPRDSVPVFHDAVLKACRGAGFVPKAPHGANQLHMVLGMVAAGAGIALVPASASKFNQGGVVYRALRPSPDNLQTVVAWRRGDTSATLAEFISAARRMLSHTAPVVR